METAKNVTGGLDGLRRVAIERLNWSRNFTLGLVNDLTDEQLLARSGGKGNHAMWVLGHLARSEDAIVSALGGGPRRLPETYERLFGRDSEPAADAGAYPSRADVVNAFESAHQRTVTWVKSLDDATAYEPTPDMLKRFAPDRITAAFGMVAHRMLHNGQVSAVRAQLGLPRLLG